MTGTPGKLIDFISTGKLKLDQVNLPLNSFAFDLLVCCYIIRFKRI